MEKNFHLLLPFHKALERNCSQKKLQISILAFDPRGQRPMQQIQAKIALKSAGSESSLS